VLGETGNTRFSSVQAAGPATDHFVVHGLGREVHQGEIERVLARADVLRRDGVEVRLHVTRERLLVQLALAVVRGADHALEVV
jgi:hypothetical protein